MASASSATSTTLRAANWVHAPIAACCYYARGGDFKFNLPGAGGNALCLSCHALLAPKLNAVNVPYKALERHGCIACHDPHASHKPQADGAHTGIGHEVERGPDPRRLGQAFSCINCHDPHGSGSPKLLRAGKTAQESFKSCHANLDQPT
jgi:predicted CXXCH cytochrome family protein